MKVKQYFTISRNQSRKQNIIKKFNLSFYLFFFVCFPLFLPAQNSPLHISHASVYDFIDCMANDQLIQLNSCIKPYSRKEVSDFLVQLDSSRSKLSKVQQKELDFHLREFNLERFAKKKDYKFNLFSKNEKFNAGLYPLGIFYSDSAFRLSVKPIWGIRAYFDGTKKDNIYYHRFGGAELQGYIGKGFSFYFSLVDNRYNVSFAEPQTLTQYPGALLKGQTANTDFAEARGGLSYTWKWGTISLYKDNVQWGNAYNGSNIFSGRAPSFVMLSLRLKPVWWFEFNYYHGWLVSDVIDTLASYPYHSGSVKREIMRDKKIAANMITFSPVKNLYISLGNSIIYSDMGFQMQYIIPFLFYKATDDTYNGTSNNAGQNSQMYFDISSRNIKHLHLYTTLFIDEISIERMFKKDKHSNYISWKIGARMSDLPKNLNVTFEYTRNNPNVYQHFIPTTSFESNSYCLGNYLRSNADEIYAAINYHLLPLFNIDFSYTHQRKGTDYVYGIGEPWGLPFMQDIILRNQFYTLKLRYEFLNNAFVYLDMTYHQSTGMREIYNAPYFRKEKGFVLMTGFNIGF